MKRCALCYAVTVSQLISLKNSREFWICSKCLGMEDEDDTGRIEEGTELVEGEQEYEDIDEDSES